MNSISSFLQTTRQSVSRSFSTSVTKRREFKDWWNGKPKPIKLFPGEVEIFREGPVLVTDTRISHIDTFDRVLKTYMFEHMISLNKNFYLPMARTRMLCNSLILITFLALLFTFVIDLLDTGSRLFFPVYIPLLISLLVGLIVWRDMRPKYRIEWFMRDGEKGGIRTEPLLREWLVNNNKREEFMDNLIEAMNRAIAGRAWWPHQEPQNLSQPDPEFTPNEISIVAADERDSRKSLKLVTSNYE